MDDDKLVKNINFPVPMREFRRLRYLKEKSGAKSWYEFLCLEKLDDTKRAKTYKDRKYQ